MTANDRNTQLTAAGDAAAIRHLEQAIASGRHWYPALLEAMALWNSAEEIDADRSYRYLIAGEAFDWLLLAERLCRVVNDLLPEDEKTALLFFGKPPLDLTREEFKKLIGSARHKQYLNYYYGVTVEEALVLAVQEEVRKEKWASGICQEKETANEVHRRIYGATRTVLLRRFRRDKGYPHSRSTTLTELKEFTYWLSKYRLKQCDRAKVASDTIKALRWLNKQRAPGRLKKIGLRLDCIEIQPLKSGG